MTIRITGDGPKITATGSGSTVLVEISTGQHDPGSFSGVHNDLSGRSTAGAHVGTAVSIDPTGFAGNLDGTITNAQLLAAAVDDLTTGGGGGGGGASLSDTTPQALGTAAAGTGTAAARDDHVHAMPTAADVGADADGAAQAVADSLGGAALLDVGTTTGTVAAGDDARLSDSRTPTSHASSHASAGSDPVTLAQSQVTNLTTDLAAKVPTTRTVNGHALSADVTITASDVGAQPSDADLTTIAGLTATTDSFIQSKSSAWAARTIAQVKTDLGVIDRVARVSGKVYTLGQGEAFSTVAGQFGSGASGKMAAHPVWLPAGSYDRVAMRTNAAGTATYRIGVYPNNPATMRPDGQTLILDCGTIDMSVTPGTLTATVTLTIPTSGIYWLAILMDAYTSAPNCCGWNGNTGVVPNLPWLGHISTGYNGRGDWGCINPSVTTGAMPTTYPTSTANDIMPQVSVRAT